MTERSQWTEYKMNNQILDPIPIIVRGNMQIIFLLGPCYTFSTIVNVLVKNYELSQNDGSTTQ